MAPARIQLSKQAPPDLPDVLARHVPLQVTLARYPERWKHFGLSLQLATADLVSGKLETAILRCPGRHTRFPNGDIGSYMLPAPEGSEYIIHPPKRRLLTVNDPGFVYQHQFLLTLGPNNSWWMVLAEEANAELALGELYFLASIASSDRIFAPLATPAIAPKSEMPLKPDDELPERPTGPQMDPALSALLKTYPPDGVPPDGHELKEIARAIGFNGSRKVLSTAIKYLRAVRDK